jgi:hypothetical protein
MAVLILLLQLIVCSLANVQESTAVFDASNVTQISGWLPSLVAVCDTLRDPGQCVETGGMDGAVGSVDFHIKTSLKEKSNIMYRIKVEGFDYEEAKPIGSVAVGSLPSEASSGSWPIHKDSFVNPSTQEWGGQIQEQYMSSDQYLVLRMTAGHYCTSLVITAYYHDAAFFESPVQGFYVTAANSTYRL